MPVLLKMDGVKGGCLVFWWFFVSSGFQLLHIAPIRTPLPIRQNATQPSVCYFKVIFCEIILGIMITTDLAWIFK